MPVLDVPQATSGWGPTFDLAPWLGNAMQSNALYLLRQAVSPGREAGSRSSFSSGTSLTPRGTQICAQAP